MEVSFSDANLTTRVEAVRYTCLAAILIALPVTADAQERVVAGRGRSTQSQAAPAAEERRPEQRSGGERRNHDQRQRQPEQQRPTTGLSPIGLGLSPIGLPPASATTVPWWERQGPPAWERRQIPAWEQKQSPSWERPQVDPYSTMNPARVLLDQERDARRLRKTPRPGYPSHRPVLPPLIYALPPYRYFPINTTLGYGVAEYPVSEAPPPPPPQMPETGFLRLEIEPQQTVQVFIDGLYVGMLGDIGIELELRLGPRRIELRAPGYRTLTFDTQIVFDRTVIYRGALERVEEAPDAPAPKAPQAPQAPQAPPAPPAPPGSRTMYLIPGCYMGNVQPTAATLRPGCDISKMTTMTPP